MRSVVRSGETVPIETAQFCVASLLKENERLKETVDFWRALAISLGVAAVVLWLAAIYVAS